jgi:hypothetical protein
LLLLVSDPNSSWVVPDVGTFLVGAKKKKKKEKEKEKEKKPLVIRSQH